MHSSFCQNLQVKKDAALLIKMQDKYKWIHNKAWTVDHPENMVHDSQVFEWADWFNDRHQMTGHNKMFGSS